MSASNAMGTTLKKGETAVAGLKSIAGLDISTETIDVTALDTEGGYKTFIAGAKDAGEVKISGYFIGETFSTMMTDFEAGTIDAYTIEFPDRKTTTGSKWEFSAVVTKLSTGADVGGAVSFEATLKVSGKPRFTKAV